MKVELITHTPEPEKVIATAAKLCYSSSDISTLKDNLTDEKVQSFIEMLMSLGHESPVEHVTFTFGIEGISRVCSHQLVRHRIASYSQKSQRYVNETKFDYITPPEIDKDFNALVKFDECMEYIQNCYEELRDILIERHRRRIMLENTNLTIEEATKIASKLANEDARFVLPNACETKIIVTMNIRSLYNFFAHRCCCFSADTEVLTNNGWKYFTDCTKDDLFYSLNLDTSDTELSEADTFISYPVNENLVRVKSQFIDQLITKDHNIVVSTSYDNKHWELMSVENAMQKKCILMKRNSNPIKGNTPTTFIIPKVYVHKNNQYAEWDTVHDEREVPIKEFLTFLGFYISDGWVMKSGQHYNVCLCKGNMDIIQKYKVICEHLTEHRVNIIQDGENCWKIVFHDRNLYEFLKPLGKAVDKHLPEFIWNLDYSLLNYLYEGLCDGDMKADNSAYSTISKQLANDIQRLLLHLGISGSVVVLDRTNRAGGFVLDRKGNQRIIKNKYPEYRITINRKKNEPIIKTTNRNPFSEEPYEGMVYCVDLKKNHTLYVRRNGFVSWSGNCRAQWEIRNVANEMLKLCYQVSPLLFKNAGPSCVVSGKCPEGKMTCGKYKEMQEFYRKLKNNT